MRDDINDGEPNWKANYKGVRAAAWDELSPDLLALFIANHRGGGAKAVEEPDEDGTQEGAVCEVDGEAVSAHVHEEAVREKLLDRGREPDAEDDEVHTERRPPLRKIWRILGKNIRRGVKQALTPGEDLSSRLGKGADVESEDYQARRDHVGEPALARDKFLHGRVHCKVA